jgi:hypothetical protein
MTTTSHSTVDSLLGTPGPSPQKWRVRRVAFGRNGRGRPYVLRDRTSAPLTLPGETPLSVLAHTVRWPGQYRLNPLGVEGDVQLRRGRIVTVNPDGSVALGARSAPVAGPSQPAGLADHVLPHEALAQERFVTEAFTASIGMNERLVAHILRSTDELVRSSTMMTEHVIALVERLIECLYTRESNLGDILPLALVPSPGSMPTAESRAA